ncbi:MAG: hypothetical protein IKP21_02135 [Bacteroidales bacterium]|nr:hypothetical protein [Bacteroidales bacterium]
MKRYLKILVTALLLAVSTVATAQIGIPGTQVTFRLNSDDWRYLRTFQLDDGADVYLYCYIGQLLLDDEGDTVLPFLRIYVNEDYDGDIYELAYERYMQQPFQSLNEYTHGSGLPKRGGLGYVGAYTSPSDQKDYQFMMTYFKDGDVTVEFRLETTKDTFQEMEFEFNDILESIK